MSPTSIFYSDFNPTHHDCGHSCMENFNPRDYCVSITFEPCPSISLFVCRYLNSVVNSEQLVEEVYDSDGEVISQETEIFAVFEFINVLGESSHLQELLVPIMPQLVYLLLVHMQVTQEQVSVHQRVETIFRWFYILSSVVGWVVSASLSMKMKMSFHILVSWPQSSFKF